MSSTQRGDTVVTRLDEPATEVAEVVRCDATLPVCRLIATHANYLTVAEAEDARYRVVVRGLRGARNLAGGSIEVVSLTVLWHPDVNRPNRLMIIDSRNTPGSQPELYEASLEYLRRLLADFDFLDTFPRRAESPELLELLDLAALKAKLSAPEPPDA
jgi:hypothetical protein